MTTNYSTLDALSTLCSSIPEWKDRLDELNGQIALRQIELARSEESEKNERPRTRSLKNKGSTESLRPKDGEERPLLAQNDDTEPTLPQLIPFESPRAEQNGFTTTTQRPGSSAAARASALGTSPQPKASSNQRPTPGALTRQTSQPVPPTQPRLGPAILRKRKTDSLASGASMAPKYRTRSMIIVYYDSAVQTAFEELVKFVSGSRNSMRKGKMAAKMAEMRRAAELEVDAEDDDDGLDDLLAPPSCSGNLVAAQKEVSVDKEGSSSAGGRTGSADPVTGPTPELRMPKLRFVSTRQMGPSRDHSARNDSAGQLSMGILRGYRRGNEGAPDIFDELDKGLEWCQSQCEHAAHQFLRDGDCSTEIDNIKRKLTEVRASAEKEVERLKKDEAASPPQTPVRGMNAEGKSRELKTPHMRRGCTNKDLHVNDMMMEVDEDEGVDDVDDPPQLMFKRSRDAHILR